MMAPAPLARASYELLGRLRAIITHGQHGTPLCGWRPTRPSAESALVWPFRRKPALPEVDLGRQELRESQVEITRQYGWQEPAPADDPDELRESLERHEDGLPEPEDDAPEIDERPAD